MVLCVGLGRPSVAFFHLLRHAFFKALLFMCVGNIIHYSGDYQDFRKAGVRPKACPVTTSFRLCANFRLCGLPFSRGFFSKDLLLEIRLVQGYPVLS